MKLVVNNTYPIASFVEMHCNKIFEAILHRYKIFVIIKVN